MGDYNVQIISAGLKKVPPEKFDEFKSEVEERLGMTDSAYHSTAPFINVVNEYHETVISAIVQAKYNRGMVEFIEWLRPMVIGGIGPEDVWAINYSEYKGTPTIHKLRELKDEDYL